MRHTIIVFLLALLSIPAAHATYSVAEVPNVHLQDSLRFTSDPAGILSQDAIKHIDASLHRAWLSASAEPVVVVIDSADTDDLDDYATRLFTAWGIGKKDKDNGVLILISRDQRQAVIRTGRGAEGVLPDAYCSRIIRNVMAPEFREENYDQGTMKAVDAVVDILTNPDNREELLSAYANNASADNEWSLEQFFTYWFYLGLLLSAGILISWVVLSFRSRGQSAHKRFNELERLRIPSLALSFFSLGLTLLAWWMVGLQMKRLRNKRRLCPSCGTAMERLDEVTDNLFLTSPQNTEEELNSVDYDVWVCPSCKDTVVEPYINKSSIYEECDLCHTRAAHQVANKVILKPTTPREGQGARVFHCKHCGNTFNRYYSIAKVPPVVVGGGRGGSGFGGGGFSGGSFGGGTTMGGGARGGW